MYDIVQARSLLLDHDPVPPAQVVSGSPTVGTAALHDFAGSEVGVWELTPGEMSDVEVDEVFVVLFGAATVAFDDGRAVTLAPGSVGRLVEGEKTVWSVTETLRKVYFA